MYLIFFIYPILLIVIIIALFRNWKKSMRNDFKNNDELSVGMTLLGGFFTTLAPLIGFIRFDAFGPDIPFSKHHVVAIELLVIVSAACYWISRFSKKKLSPFVNLLLRAGLIQGIILDLFVTIHFAEYMGMGVIFPLFGFELLAPPMAMLFLIYELHCNFRIQTQNPGLEFSLHNTIPVQSGVVLVLVFVEQLMLLPMGFQWNSLLLAFTESRGFVFSINSVSDFLNY